MFLVSMLLLAVQSPNVPTSTPSIEQKPTLMKQTSEIKNSKPTIQESIYDGKYLRLSDNTLWEIKPSDTGITQSWVTPAEINIASSNDPTYTHQLTNSLTGSSVLARRVTIIPSPRLP